MEDGSVEETVVVRYLLGDLPEETLIQVEDRAFSDPEYLRLIDAVEADLIDAYVHNQLPAVERRQFENRFFASAERRKKVEFARTWSQVAGEAKPAPAGAAASRGLHARGSWRDVLSFLRGPAPAFRFAMAAALVLVGVVSWQVIQSSRLRSRVSELETERSGLQQRGQTLESALAAERARADGLSGQVQHGSAAAVASLTLMPGALRGESVRPEILIMPSAQIARLEVQLEPKDRYLRYQAELRTQKGDEVLILSNLREQHSPQARSVVVEIPASALSPGNYELTLKGGLAGRQYEDIGYYRFSVRRP
jgi:hypothetical protein